MNPSPCAGGCRRLVDPGRCFCPPCSALMATSTPFVWAAPTAVVPVAPTAAHVPVWGRS